MKGIGLYLLQICFFFSTSYSLTDKEIWKIREEVRGMFYHAYDGYMKYAYPYDELRPLSCDGHDTWGSYSLTLIDALDTLAVMGNKTEFQRVAHLITQKANFDVDINVSVFETNIRIVGGLLSAHLMSRKMGVDVEQGWPCKGPLLTMAKDMADRLLPAFDTPTGMPYGTVNLKDGVPEGETTVTCTAGVGTYIVEFGTLSRLTGDPVYEEVALRALHAVWDHRSAIDLLGNHVDVSTGRWTAQDSGIGAGIDSYFEYLVKGATLLQRPELMAIFNQARVAADKHLRHEDWYLWATMTKGHVTMAVFQSLEAYWPGVLALVGDVNSALKSVFNYHQVWKQFGFTPEFYNIPRAEASANREGYPLRPELVESLMYLYRATKDETILQMGADLVASIQHTARTECGYATVKNVNDHTLENRMESFFLAETTKYLYLLFDTENWIHNTGERGQVHRVGERECIVEGGGYIFNTEAHPIDPGALACCFTKEDDWSLSITDQVALILDPAAPWKKHVGHKMKPPRNMKIEEECSEKEQNKDLEKDESQPESKGEFETVLTVKESTSAEGIQDGKSPDAEDHSSTVEVEVNIEKIPVDKKAFNKEGTEETADDIMQISVESEKNGSHNVKVKESDVSQGEDIKKRELSQEEGIIEETEKPKTIKKEGGPRFSSLSETVERGLGGNTSGMEAAEITPSVSSSKYTTNSGTPRIVPEPTEPSLEHSIKKIFILEDLKERLITDLNEYRNFTLSSSYSLLSCEHPPFINMINIKGQMFNP
ncbi:ER degradation-enhancing alpha-mannosidase-like protein 2 [Penaeus japonicus]|uniref:ER degradation-enhancing alpha-mannosidase-like protein 2 n=1 Tax=Penaeus japonicus TaxID=27405 RepID=UPI001C70F5C9|nr:ER degradation-enhancing alpha-mannosidase-like protein 2 [Penaeus japonicus]